MLAGTCQGPKDIPDTVAQGAAAAARVLQNILRNSVALDHASLTIQHIEKRIDELQPVIN